MGVSELAKKKTDVSAARSLVAAIGPNGLNPSAVILTGSNSGEDVSPRHVHHVQGAYDAQSAQASSGGKSKRKRINMAFTDENIADMRIAAAAFGVSQTEFTNMVLREWFESHRTELAAYKSATAAFER